MHAISLQYTLSFKLCSEPCKKFSPHGVKKSKSVGQKVPHSIGDWRGLWRFKQQTEIYLKGLKTISTLCLFIVEYSIMGWWNTFSMMLPPAVDENNTQISSLSHPLPKPHVQLPGKMVTKSTPRKTLSVILALPRSFCVFSLW